MAELVTIARPYAEAVFALAKERGELPKWSEMLALMAGVYTDPQTQAALANPKVTTADVERIMLSVCGERIDGAARNLIQVLAHNHRLPALPHIRELYEHLRADDEGVVEARISSAFPLDDGQLEQIVRLLSRRYQKQISPTVSIDPELIGGVRIQVGDKVWDASVRGKLQKMAAALTK
ncbi:MAG TPA: F0F1 ATP synthase subunit delta [Burkholderiales bacterium]|jgi:F-type H+-transporting ATPase subunit delta|nr:F0F1 ATP synthase subunit delta [Burkholderiales bacterium]